MRIFSNKLSVLIQSHHTTGPLPMSHGAWRQYEPVATTLPEAVQRYSGTAADLASEPMWQHAAVRSILRATPTVIYPHARCYTLVCAGSIRFQRCHHARRWMLYLFQRHRLNMCRASRPPVLRAKNPQPPRLSHVANSQVTLWFITDTPSVRATTTLPSDRLIRQVCL